MSLALIFWKSEEQASTVCRTWQVEERRRPLPPDLEGVSVVLLLLPPLLLLESVDVEVVSVVLEEVSVEATETDVVEEVEEEAEVEAVAVEVVVEDD